MIQFTVIGPSRGSAVTGFPSICQLLPGLLLLLAPALCTGQLNNQRTKMVAFADTLSLDSLTIIPGSLTLIQAEDTLADHQFTLLMTEGRVVLHGSLSPDSVRAVYRVLPFQVRTEYSRKSPDLISGEGVEKVTRYTIGSGQPETSLFDGDGLTKSGSISRGIAFGNTQNLSVNSSLNLQLSGRITDRYNLLASVSDDNIPIQPEGNSQQLQDFDQVFIQLSDERSTLIAGDFILRKPTGYFVNYFKRAQGAYVNFRGIQTGPKQSGPKMGVEASASVSKGRFARNVIQGIEGNQGPYRLRGADNELFIVILAGTEAVYIDGKRMVRGQDRDYVIDYNAAEIIFTPRQFITKDRRITVEFQYSDKRYARPLIHTSINLQTSKSEYFLNLYSESDARNQPLQQDLTQSDKAILSAAGDNALSAFRSGIDSVGYNSSNVQYALRDSLGIDSVLVYSVHPDSALYRVVFSYVGPGNGDYAEDGFTALGRKFKWIQPMIQGDQLIHYGDYAPLLLLYAPQKKQTVSAGAEWSLARNAGTRSQLNAEAAMSVNDKNTFSSLDSRDDQGYALRTTYEWEKQRKKIISNTGDSVQKKIIAVGARASYEYVSRDFSRIERFREVEFERNWNVQNIALNNDQHIASAALSVKFRNAGSAELGGDMFALGRNFNGRKGFLNTHIQTESGTRIFITSSWLNTKGKVQSEFLRHKSDLSKRIGKIRIGFRDEHELNKYFEAGSNALSPGSYRFYDWQVEAGNSDTTRVQVSMYYRDRWDERPNPDLSRASRADQYGATAVINGSSGNRLKLQASNRRLRAVDPELFTQNPENTLLLRGEYAFRVWKGFVQGASFYEIGSGLEQKKEFIYIEVPAGQGTYVWVDYNQDGIKDLNEFEIAQFPYEANYLRTFVQTNDYEKTYTNQFSQNLTLTPSLLWKQEDKTWKKIVSRFSNQSAYRIDRKTQREEKSQRLNPFLTDIADSSLLALNSSFRNIIFFNKANPRFGADITLQEVGGKSLLSSGFESRSDAFLQLAARWNAFTTWTIIAEVKTGDKEVASDFLSGRNYAISSRSGKPRLTWQPGRTQRVEGFIEYLEKVNSAEGGGEKAFIRKAGIEWNVNNPDRGLFQATFQTISIDYNGATSSSLAFDMLEGLSPGLNYTWSASLQRTISKSLQLNLTYNGRKSEELRPVHSGGIQVRAFF